MRYYTVVLDGIDKTGKDTIWGYVDYLSGRKYVINSRGVMSQIAYSELYNRPFALNVLLTVEKEDWETRCKITHEPPIDYEKNMAAFNKAFEKLMDAGMPVARIDTTNMTPYMAAKSIIMAMNALNDGDEE